MQAAAAANNVAPQVDSCLAGSPRGSRRMVRRESAIVRENLVTALAAYNAKEVKDAKRTIFKPDADGCDCSGWIWSTLCAWRGRSLRHILPPWFVVVLEAVLVCVLCEPNIMGARVLRLPSAGSVQEGYSLLAVPVSFLLVFRLNRAAVRFYDARAAFGKLIEICRVLCAQAAEYCGHDHRARDDCCRWAVAFPVASRNYLRGIAPDATVELRGILTAAEAHRMNCAAMQPLLCLDRMRAAMRAGMQSNNLESAMLVSQQLRCMEDSITILTGTVGTMERINNTPLPFAYVAHLRQFMLIYLLGMPWAFQSSYGWATVLVIGLVSFAMLGVEASAVACERPFSSNANHLPMDAFCKVVSKNIEQILSQATDDELDLEGGVPGKGLE